MPRRITPNKRNKRCSSDNSDSTLSDMDENEVEDEDEGENVSETQTESKNSPNKRQRRLLINQQKEPLSPDHTYKTSDEEYCSEQERECDKVLETMLPCRGRVELLSSDDENGKGNGGDGGVIGDGHDDDDLEDDDDDDVWQ